MNDNRASITNTSQDTVLEKSLTSILIARNDTFAIQALRYMVVGFVATAADMSVLYSFTERLHFTYTVSAAFGFIVGIILSYLLSKSWVFASRNVGSRATEFALFTVIGLIGLGLTELIIFSGVELLNLHYMTVKLMAVVAVFAWNFSARRALLFRRKEL